MKIISAPSGSQHNPYLLSEEDEKRTLRKQDENKKRLRVPRRPPWRKFMTTAQLDRQEKDAFLEWRRGLAEYVFLIYRFMHHTDIFHCKIGSRTTTVSC